MEWSLSMRPRHNQHLNIHQTKIVQSSTVIHNAELRTFLLKRFQSMHQGNKLNFCWIILLILKIKTSQRSYTIHCYLRQIARLDDTKCDAYMRHWPGSSLVQPVASRLLGNWTNDNLSSTGPLWTNLTLKMQKCISRKRFWKCRLPNVDHFVQDSMC